MSKTERTDGIYILHIADSLQDVIDLSRRQGLF